MPHWAALTDQDRANLVAFIKTFSSRFRNEVPDEPIPIPPETPDTFESQKRGEELYQKSLKCFECHGTSGRGDGPSAPSLRDNKGNPAPPFDFTSGSRFKCGETNQELYRIFMTGLDGSPMPSWIDSVTPDQGWDLVHYLRTLQPKYKRGQAKGSAHPRDKPKKYKTNAE
jgi:cytochrome c oxidase cbb3-type subunit 2